MSAIEMNGGAGRDRTDDLYNAIVALSQLSYGPEKSAVFSLLCPFRSSTARFSRGNKFQRNADTLQGFVLAYQCQGLIDRRRRCRT